VALELAGDQARAVGLAEVEVGQFARLRVEGDGAGAAPAAVAVEEFLAGHQAKPGGEGDKQDQGRRTVEHVASVPGGRAAGRPGGRWHRWRATAGGVAARFRLQRTLNIPGRPL